MVNAASGGRKTYGEITLKTRRLGLFQVSEIGFGCMNFSHGYGKPIPDNVSIQILNRALDLGVTLFDTAAVYGFGLNETLLSRWVGPVRDQITLCSKGGMSGEMTDNGYQRKIDSSAATIRQNCEDSLKRLGVDVIDLYYVHRWDKTTPIEEVAYAMGELVRAGKIRSIGFSEISASTLRKAHAVHPVAAVQSEYSLWTRNPEIALRDTCRELGVNLVAFSPLGRKFLTGRFTSLSDYSHQDLRQKMPRFLPGALEQNLSLLPGLEGLAREAGCSMAQLSLAWVLAQGDHIVPIPGTTNLAHLEEDMSTSDLAIPADILQRAGGLINEQTVMGARYDAVAQASVDTEDF
jgi:aryl-alcohol dehydrogenase-like predicted oxidoreductase